MAGPSGSQGAYACPAILRRVSTLALITTYLLIVLGSTVRVTHSGMGCRSWPLCDGHLAPLDNFHSAIEQYHRYGAAIVSVLVYYTGFLAWRHCRHQRRVFIPAVISCGVILLQVGLGALTVLTHNAPVTVGMHLLGGVLELGIVTVVAITAHGKALYQSDRVFPSSGVAKSAVVRWSLLAVLATLGIIITGSIVVNSHAAQACPQWPFCSYGAAPARLVDFQYLHRATVLVGGLLLLVFFVRAWNGWRSLGVGPLIVVDIALFGIQVVAGALSAVLRAPADIQDLHLAIAALFWAGIIALVSMAWDRTSNLERANGDREFRVLEK
ncbi:MAG: COX15/CtaA family protein [Ferrimicrobium sp.]|uniref:COX15/CtaA family protein n=1 Tax=Ferrimicrobium sp. TaxID=2926050 RepID=UPI002629CB74|nr:COX15/CtaA family protein [Ferrimicrobium sp.]